MQANGIPFVVKFFLLLVIFALGFLLARDLFSIINGAPYQKNSSYAAADSSPSSTKTKMEKPSSEVSPSALPADSKEPLREKAAEVSSSLSQAVVENLPGDNTTAGRPLELGNGPTKKSGSDANPLRADEGRPMGDLRTGADAKPLGSLRGPAESGIAGSLRPDERLLPTGSLRSDEGHLPTGNLR